MPIRIDGDNATATPGITGGDADTGLVFGTDQIEAVTGGTTRFTVESNGNVTVENGNLVLASGSGIDFSATADGSGTTTSELLDDYEEGTFTPVFEGGTTAGTYTYGAQVGMYTKIGRAVNATLTLTNISYATGQDGSGTLLITGLPFVSSSTASINFTGATRTDRLTFGASVNYIVPTIPQSVARVSFSQVVSGTGDTAINVTAIANGQTDIFVNITYMTD